MDCDVNPTRHALEIVSRPNLTEASAAIAISGKDIMLGLIGGVEALIGREGTAPDAVVAINPIFAAAIQAMPGRGFLDDLIVIAENQIFIGDGLACGNRCQQCEASEQSPFDGCRKHN